MRSSSIFLDRRIVLAITYAPAGLGHLRVADALYHGLPKDVVPVLLGSDDTSITYIHRFSSIHPLTRALMVFWQQGLPEKIFTFFYRLYLLTSTEIIYKQLRTILSQRIDPVKTLVVVATHFGLAHQIAAIKEYLEKKEGIKIILVVQVTDDSPQLIWYVNGADMIFVPSVRTKESLLSYGQKAYRNFKQPKFIVAPYPVNPLMAINLPHYAFQSKLRQLSSEEDEEINICIPLSGAAVGTDILYKIIKLLPANSTRFRFHIVAKEAPYTQKFILDLLSDPHTLLHIGRSDREVIDLYDRLYQYQTIALEITKPSEQAFKALFSPRQKGGAILLFLNPVGKQEYDNLDFLRRHGLIPSTKMKKILWDWSQGNISVNKHLENEILKEALNWRGIELPKNSFDTVEFINFSLKKGIFSQMANFHMPSSLTENHKQEISPEGVDIFWDKVEEHLDRVAS
ncbi:hypothetical protein M1271_05635 [Patescibacteria group bacterium]|nr:hypothetical protein [Patescibacteria group bacterium]MCL5797730.1 hypothetical protein [Patescibacteria group bacterium]